MSPPPPSQYVFPWGLIGAQVPMMPSDMKWSNSGPPIFSTLIYNCSSVFVFLSTWMWLLRGCLYVFMSLCMFICLYESVSVCMSFFNCSLSVYSYFFLWLFLLCTGLFHFLSLSICVGLFVTQSITGIVGVH